jgi:hypothetical protein
MSVDYRRTSPGDAPGESETPMFAGAPMWERGDKARHARRQLFRDANEADEPAAARATAAEPISADEATRETAMSPNGDDAPFVYPATRTTGRRERSLAPAAVGVGLAAIAALAVAGYYATRPADRAMTPGGAPATSIAAAPAPAALPTSLAQNTPPASAAAQAAGTSAAAPAATTTSRSVTTTTRTTRAPAEQRTTTITATPERPVTSPSATDAGVNTSAATSVGVTPPVPSTAAPPPAVDTAPTLPASPTAPPVNTMPAPATTPAPSTTTPDVTPPSATTPPTPGASGPTTPQ